MCNLKAPSSTTPTTPSTTPSTPTSKIGSWCVAKADVSDDELQANLDYACGQGIDCSPIQPGGACFEPTTLSSHATYAMNLLYQMSRNDPSTCNFSKSATLTSQNPSKLYHIWKCRFVLNVEDPDNFCEVWVWSDCWICDVGYETCNYPGWRVLKEHIYWDIIVVSSMYIYCGVQRLFCKIASNLILCINSTYFLFLDK